MESMKNTTQNQTPFTYSREGTVTRFNPFLATKNRNSVSKNSSLNPTTMENFYNSTGVSSPSRTEPVEVRTEQCLSLSKGSSSSFFKSFALTLAMLVVGIGSSWGQVSTYTKSITSGTYTAHTGTVLLTNADDADASASNIGFNFSFAGVVYTQFVANSNGYITLGGTGQGSWYTPLSSINNVIAAVARDGKATGDVRVQVQGVAPNRVCNIQYTNFDGVFYYILFILKVNNM